MATYNSVRTGELSGQTVAAQMPDVPSKWVKIKADVDNVGRVAIGGNENVELPDGDTDQVCGYVLNPGEETPWLPIDRLSRLWYISDYGVLEGSQQVGEGLDNDILTYLILGS